MSFNKFDWSYFEIITYPTIIFNFKSLCYLATVIMEHCNYMFFVT